MDSEILHRTALIYRSHFHAIAAIPSFSGEGRPIQFQLSANSKLWLEEKFSSLAIIGSWRHSFFSKDWWPFPAEFCLRPEAIFWRHCAHVPYFFHKYETHQCFSSISKYMTLNKTVDCFNSSMTFLSSWGSGSETVFRHCSYRDIQQAWENAFAPVHLDSNTQCSKQSPNLSPGHKTVDPFS